MADNYVNTRTIMGDQEALDALVAGELEDLVEDGVNSTGDYALYRNTGLKRVNMPALTSCGQYCFQGCTGLTEVTFELLSSIGSYAFSGCSSLATFNAPSLTSINQYAFQNCSKLTSIDLTNVNTLGNYSFYGSGLTSVSIPKIASVNQYLFSDCKSLASVEMPKASTINTYAFQNCTKLTTIDLTNTSKPTINANAFNGSGLMHLIIRSTTMATLSNVSAFTGTPIANGIGGIYVPSDLVDTYKARSNWSTYADMIYPIDQYPKTEFGSITDTWAEIFAAEDDGTYSSKYSVGDTKAVEINGGYVMMQIASINGDTLSDGSGTAKITWLCKEIYAQHNMNSTSTTSGGWPATAMYTYLTSDIYDKMNSAVKNRVVQVKKTYYDYSSSSTKSSDDYIWIPSYREVNFGTDKENSGVIYSELFTTSGIGNATDKVKKYAGSASGWWLRSARSSSDFCFVSNGGYMGGNSASNSLGVVFGFCT